MNSSDADRGTSPTATRIEPSTYGSLASLVFLLGIYNGVAPFVVRLVFGGDRLLLVLPLRLRSPWWWIVSVGVLLVTVVLLEVLDRARRRAESVRGAQEPHDGR